jgi:hypothetical protein
VSLLNLNENEFGFKFLSETETASSIFFLIFFALGFVVKTGEGGEGRGKNVGNQFSPNWQHVRKTGELDDINRLIRRYSFVCGY